MSSASSRHVLVSFLFTIQYYYYVYFSTSIEYHVVLIASPNPGIRLRMYHNEVVLVVCTLQYYYYVYCSTCTEYHVILIPSPNAGIRLQKSKHASNVFKKLKAPRNGRFPDYCLRFFCTCSNELRLISASSSSRLSKQASHRLASLCAPSPCFAMAMLNSECGFCLSRCLLEHFQNPRFFCPATHSVHRSSGDPTSKSHTA
jgi:hypothetical protein